MKFNDYLALDKAAGLPAFPAGGNMAPMDADALRLRARFRGWILLFMAGLVLSGVTAIPLKAELDWMAAWAVRLPLPEGIQAWVLRVREGVSETYARHPFMAYGTDWLAFGHFMIALAFVGLLRDPVRNRWLLQFGMLSCVLVIPYALLMGPLRGIPFFWQLIDCAFGVGGLIPLLLASRTLRRLESAPPDGPQSRSG